MDPEPMYHVTCTQTSSQHGEFSAMFISRTIELCNVSRVVLHSATTLVDKISLTAAYGMKTGFKVKGIPYGMQRQPGQQIPHQAFNWSACFSAYTTCQAPIVDSGTALHHSE